MPNRTVLDWLRYSGASVCVTANPWHWRWRPWFYRDTNEWAGPNERTWHMGWLMLNIRVWIDDGIW